MVTNHYRTGQAAKLLARSSHEVRKLCEAGLIDAELTGSNHWRIPAQEIDRLKREGIPEIPSGMDEEADERPLRREAETTEESAEVRRERDSVAIAENRLRRRRIELEELSVEDEFSAREQRSALMAVENQRGDWIGGWVAYALNRLPEASPAELELAIHSRVEECLERLSPNSPHTTTRRLVDAAVATAAAPYQHAKEMAQAVDEAMQSLPYGARGHVEPSKWQLEAKRACSAAVGSLANGSSYKEAIAVARAAIDPVVRRFEKGAAVESALEGLKQWRIFDATREERDLAHALVAEALAQLPPTASRDAVRKETERTLISLNQKVDARIDQERCRRSMELAVSTKLSHVGAYLDREYDFDSSWERDRTATELREELRPELIERLMMGDLSEAEIPRFIEKHIRRSLR